MGFEEKSDELKGRAKEATGAATGDDELKRDGQADQTKASAKQKVEDAKDTVKGKIDDLLK